MGNRFQKPAKTNSVGPASVSSRHRFFSLAFKINWISAYKLLPDTRFSKHVLLVTDNFDLKVLQEIQLSWHCPPYIVTWKTYCAAIQVGRGPQPHVPSSHVYLACSHCREKVNFFATNFKRMCYFTFCINIFHWLWYDIM